MLIFLYYTYTYNMKTKYFHVILFLFIILFIFMLFLLYPWTLKLYNKTEKFEQDPRQIDCYVITLKKPEKMKNIELQQEKIPYPIEIVDAVFGDDLDINRLVTQGLVSPQYASLDTKERKRQIGCYMSHLKTLNKIAEKQNQNEYSIIFEDDFDIYPEFTEKLHQYIRDLKDIDFDLLFLGNLIDAYGKHVVSEIYEMTTVYGTHGYLVNNKHISRIQESMKYIDNHVDLKYSESSSHTLNILVVHPRIVNQLRNEFSSDILVK